MKQVLLFCLELMNKYWIWETKIKEFKLPALKMLLHIKHTRLSANADKLKVKKTSWDPYQRQTLLVGFFFFHQLTLVDMNLLLMPHCKIFKFRFDVIYHKEVLTSCHKKKLLQSWNAVAARTFVRSNLFCLFHRLTQWMMYMQITVMLPKFLLFTFRFFEIFEPFLFFWERTLL